MNHAAIIILIIFNRIIIIIIISNNSQDILPQWWFDEGYPGAKRSSTNYRVIRKKVDIFKYSKRKVMMTVTMLITVIVMTILMLMLSWSSIGEEMEDESPQRSAERPRRSIFLSSATSAKIHLHGTDLCFAKTTKHLLSRHGMACHDSNYLDNY